MDVSQLRTAYSNEVLLESDLDSDPFTQFDKWFKDAFENSNISEPNAMCLCTCTPDGKPSSRYVLMKSFSKNGYKNISFMAFGDSQNEIGNIRAGTVLAVISPRLMKATPEYGVSFCVDSEGQDL